MASLLRFLSSSSCFLSCFSSTLSFFSSTLSFFSSTLSFFSSTLSRFSSTLSFLSSVETESSVAVVSPVSGVPVPSSSADGLSEIPAPSASAGGSPGAWISVPPSTPSSVPATSAAAATTSSGMWVVSGAVSFIWMRNRLMNMRTPMGTACERKRVKRTIQMEIRKLSIDIRYPRRLTSSSRSCPENLKTRESTRRMRKPMANRLPWRIACRRNSRFFCFSHVRGSLLCAPRALDVVVPSTMRCTPGVFSGEGRGNALIKISSSAFRWVPLIQRPSVPLPWGPGHPPFIL